MDFWKMTLFLLTFCSLVQIYVGMSLTVDEDGALSEWQQDPSLNTGLTEAVDALMKRSKALRFYGLMGKRSDEKPIKADRKKKGGMFVGLMGRSISDSLPRIRPSTASEVLEKSRKQGSQEEEWVQIIY